MSWQIPFTLIIRSVIDDTSEENPTYEDSKILQAAVAGALYASVDYDFDTEYTFDFETPDISPDPMSDNVAVALMTLRAACMLQQGQFATAVKDGIEVRDGDSQVKTTGSFGGWKDIILLGPCGSYQKLLKTVGFDNMVGRFGAAVLGPASINSYNSYGSSCAVDLFNRFIV